MTKTCTHAKNNFTQKSRMFLKHLSTQHSNSYLYMYMSRKIHSTISGPCFRLAFAKLNKDLPSEKHLRRVSHAFFSPRDSFIWATV